jgi:hypothetical protein
MLFDVVTLQAIAAGTVTVAFRRWRKLRVRSGSTFRTALGVVEVTGVATSRLEAITDEEARFAGYQTREALLRELERHSDGEVYRIGLRFGGADPRVSLRARERLDPAERAELLERLGRFGAKTADGPWAERILRLIESHPFTRAAELADMLGMETLRFKARVRQLKELGLTESLEIGYRLSPRGRALLESVATSEWPLSSSR